MLTTVTLEVLLLLSPLIAGLLFIGRPGQVAAIARNTFVESVRQPIYFIIIFLSGIFQIFNTWGTAYSMGQAETGELSGDNKLLLDVGLATVFVCAMVLAAFIATAVISREIENKTVLTVISKPIARRTLLAGKFLGVSVAMLLASLTMILFLLLGIRHGVMSTAADDPDQPVILFTFLATALSIGIAIWCNFFYGWVFTQTATMLMFPLTLGAWVTVLFISKKWHFQPLLTDIKPQVLMACAAVVLAELVLTSVAVAASTRLGQVMTIVVCSGVFLFGLLSNHFLGSRAYRNEIVARIEKAEPGATPQTSLSSSGDTYTIMLETEPRVRLKPGMPFYYGPNPGGFGLSTVPFPPPSGDTSTREVVFDEQREPALAITGASGRALTIRHIGPDARLALEPPKPGDYVFVHPTRTSPLALAAWAVIPNVQFFWLVDAVTQHQDIPVSHLFMLLLYTATQVGIFLSVAVLLFQNREVG